MEHEDRPVEMSLENMKEIVDRAREVEFDLWQLEEITWRKQQRLKAPAIIDLLRVHLPNDALEEVKQFLSTLYGCDCFREALQVFDGPSPDAPNCAQG